MKKYYTLYLLLLLIVGVWAVDANEFLIGAYSQYQIRYAGENFAAKFDSCQGKFNLYQFRKFKMYHFIQLC